MRLSLFLLERMVAAVVVGCVFGWHGNSGVLCFETLAPFGKSSTAVRSQQHKNKNIDENNDSNLPNDCERIAASSKRRGFIGSMLSVPLLLPFSVGPFSITEPVAFAAETVDKKPFAPLENLLPAIRVKRSIDSAIGLTRSLVIDPSRVGNESSSTTGAGTTKTPIAVSQENTLMQLESLLLKPTNYVQSGLQLQGVPSKPADLYLKDYQSIKGDLPFQKALIQSGDVDAWKRLKRREKKLEGSSSIRTALNAYTNKLSFSGDSYLLNVDRQTKSSMVREDRLPDIKQVITSDMDMRYLYRNQVLTAMDDVKAELEYQLGQSSFDGTELLDLLNQAKESMDQWLSLVPPEDVKEALKVIVDEESNVS